MQISFEDWVHTEGSRIDSKVGDPDEYDHFLAQTAFFAGFRAGQAQSGGWENESCDGVRFLSDF